MGSAFIAGGIYNFAAGGIPDDRIFRYLDHFILCCSACRSDFLHDTAEYTGALCYRLLGKTLFLRAHWRCMLISSLMIDYVAPLLTRLLGRPLLAALCTGVFAGLGYAVISHAEIPRPAVPTFIIMAVQESEAVTGLSGKISFADGCDHHSSGGRISASGMWMDYLRNDCEFSAGNRGRQADVRHQFREKMTLVVTEHGKEICDVIDSAGTAALQYYRDRAVTAVTTNRSCDVCATTKRMYLLQHAVMRQTRHRL